MKPELYLGLMSGSSADGLDCALFDFSQGPPPTLIDALHRSYPPILRKILLDASEGGALDIRDCALLDSQIGDLMGQCLGELLAQADLSPHEVAAAGCHGPTLLHRPDGEHPYSLQLGDANRMAAVSRVAIVSDLRRADMAAGGQGAPLAPLFHDFCWRVQVAPDRPLAVINLGGIANATILSDRSDADAGVLGFDAGPGNCLLDSWCQQHQGRAYDDGGSWAAGGQMLPALLAKLLSDPWFAKPPPKSTGRDYFNLKWLRRLSDADAMAPQDVQATLVELTARTLAQALGPSLSGGGAATIMVCGGGAANSYLVQRLADHCQPADIRTTAAAGLDPRQVETAAFAWLARLRLNGEALPSAPVTGARQPVLAGGLWLPPNHTELAD